jgi:hypothetical protein
MVQAGSAWGFTGVAILFRVGIPRAAKCNCQMHFTGCKCGIYYYRKGSGFVFLIRVIPIFAD